MKTTRGCSSFDGGTLQKQAIPMDLDVYWCDGSVRERWKLNVPSTITRSINGLDSQNRSRTKDLVISIINNQHPLKRRTNKRGLERMTYSGSEPAIPVSKTVIPAFVPGTSSAGESVVSAVNTENSDDSENSDDTSRTDAAQVRAVRRFLGRKTSISTATQWIYPRRSNDSGVTKTTKYQPSATRFFDVLTARIFQEKKS